MKNPIEARYCRLEGGQGTQVSRFQQYKQLLLSPVFHALAHRHGTPGLVIQRYLAKFLLKHWRGELVPRPGTAR